MSNDPAPTGNSIGETFGRDAPFRTERAQRFLQYLAVGVIGLGINEGGLFLVTGVLGFPYVLGGLVGRVTSISANYVMNDSWTWRDRGETGLRQWGWRGVKYVATRVVGMAIGLGSLVVFVELLGLHYLVANVLAVGVGVFWGFAASELWVWPTPGAAGTRSPLGSQRHGGTRSALGIWSALGTRSRGGTRSTRRATGIGRVPGDLLPAAIRNPIRSVDAATWYVLGLSVAMFVGFAVYTSLLYEAYWLTGSDFGSYVHMFATTVNGQGFLEHGKYRISHPYGSYWGAHFSLTLLFFLPFYALVASPITLLVLKSLLLAASVPALWFVARTHIGSDRVAGLLVASYASNPFLWSAWLFDFQEQALLPVLIFAAYYAFTTERYRLFLGLLTLVLLTNEFVVIVVGGALVGLFVAAFRAGRVLVGLRGGVGGGDGRSSETGGLATTYRAARSRGLVGSELAVFAVAGLLLVVVKVGAGLVMSRFSRFSGIPVASIASPLRELVAGPRVGMSELLLAMATNPAVIVETFTIHPTQKVLFFVAFLAPVLFLALYDEFAVGALIPFVGFAWFLSGRPIYYQFGAHYPLYLLPFVYVGAVRVVGRYSVPGTLPSGGRLRGILTRLFVIVLVLNVVGGVGLGLEKRAVPGTSEHTETLSRAIESIPEEASLLTQNDVYPHVATRPHSTFVTRPGMFERYQAMYGTVTPEYVLYDRQLNARSVDWSHAVRRAFDDRLSGEYGLYRYEDGIYVYKRGYRGLPEGITSEYSISRQYDASELRIADGRFEEGLVRAASTDSDSDRNIWFGPYATLPPGTYTATFRVNVTGTARSSGQDSDSTPGTGAGPESDPVSEPGVESASILRLNVAAEHNSRVVASESVRATDGWENVTLAFTLDESTSGIEFRGAWGNAPGTVALQSVDVSLRRSVDERYSANEFGVTRGQRPNGRIRATNSENTTGQNVWFGPYADLPPGTYDATFRVNVTRAETTMEPGAKTTAEPGADTPAEPGAEYGAEKKPVLVLNVAAERNERVLVREPVRATEGWKNVTLTFTLDRPTSGVEFRGTRGDASGTVAFEYVIVERRDRGTSG